MAEAGNGLDDEITVEKLVRNDNASAAVEALSKRIPNLKRVEFSSEKKNDGLQNFSQYDVYIDFEAIKDLLKTSGLSDSDHTELEINFRNAGIAEKSAAGDIIGGLFNGVAEIYVSYLLEELRQMNEQNIEAKLANPRLVLVPINEKALANRLAHEIRHFIQDKNNMFPDQRSTSSTETLGRHHADPGEIDAMRYAKTVEEALVKFIRIGTIPEMPGLYDESVKSLDFGGPTIVMEMINVDLPVAVLVDNDPKGGKVVRMIDRFVQEKMEGLEQLTEIVSELDSLVKDKQIGFAEQRYLIGKMHVLSEIFGTGEVKSLLADLVKANRAILW